MKASFLFLTTCAEASRLRTFLDPAHGAPKLERKQLHIQKFTGGRLPDKEVEEFQSAYFGGPVVPSYESIQHSIYEPTYSHAQPVVDTLFPATTADVRTTSLKHTFTSFYEQGEDGNSEHYLVSYGSFMDRESRAKTFASVGFDASTAEYFPVKIFGWNRGWYVQDKSDFGGITYLGASTSMDMNVPKPIMNGIAVKVDKQILESFDKREGKEFARRTIPHVCESHRDDDCMMHSVQCLQRHCPKAKFWMYDMSPKEIKPASSANPLVQSYVDLFINGCLQIQAEFNITNFAETCVTSTTGWSPYWVNDRVSPRRPLAHQQSADAIDHVLSSNVKQYSSIRIESGKDTFKSNPPKVSADQVEKEFPFSERNLELFRHHPDQQVDSVEFVINFSFARFARRFVDVCNELRNNDLHFFLIFWVVVVNILSFLFTWMETLQLSKTGLLVMACMMGYPGIWLGTSCLETIRTSSKEADYELFRKRLAIVTFCWTLVGGVGLVYYCVHANTDPHYSLNVMKNPHLRKMWVRMFTTIE